MKEHWYYFKWIYIIAFIAITITGSWIWYEYQYPCVYGHYEEVWHTNYVYNADGTMYPMGGYYANEFVCDCRTVRDSIK